MWLPAQGWEGGAYLRLARAGAHAWRELQLGALPDAIAHGDKVMVARAKGVGSKLAQRIVNELAGKMGSPASAAVLGASAPARR